MRNIEAAELDRVSGGAGPVKAILTGAAIGGAIVSPFMFTDGDAQAKRSFAAAGLSWGGAVGWLTHLARRRR